MPTPPADPHPLLSRLRAAADVLLAPAVTDGTVDRDDAGALLEALVAQVRANRDPSQAWLLFTAVSTVYPTDDQLQATLRAFELSSPREAALWLLDIGLATALELGTPNHALRIVEGGVVVDVNFAARNNVHTGIQRVVRSVLPEWHRRRELTATAWTISHSALRTLGAEESARVLSWTQWHTGGATPAAASAADEAEATIVVPWRCVVVVAEVPVREVCPRLAGLARSSGNRVVAIGYDCIPVVSADMVPLVEPNRFVTYLAAVKHMRRVAGISVSATAEFQGFSDMLGAQGLAGPVVIECALPTAGPTTNPTRAFGPRPSILCVGSLEPRKNQEGVLYAAEVLWREGLDFELHFVGGGGLGRGLPATVRRLARAGRPVSIAIGISDVELDQLYADARFTVFPSLHEGYGLPVVESLAHGVPVITSDYGSTREIGASGGTLLIDPRDDEALVTAMRTLLTDEAALAGLRAELADRPERSWADYADELWAGLVAAEQVDRP